MTIQRTAFLALLLAMAPVAAMGQAGSSFEIIVHVDNPTTSLSHEEVSGAFLKRIGRWSFGDAVLPVDRDSGSEIRIAFSTAMLGREAHAIRSYWQREFFSGRDTPPAELASDEAVIAFVASNPGAIGYVSGRVRLPATVKTVEVKR